MKHAVLLALIAAARGEGALSVVETHAGAGLYDLQGEVARRTGEAEAGVGRLMAAGALPGPLDALRQAVRRENPNGGLRFYPGSPLVALGALGPGDRYRGCELRADDADSLAALLRARARGAAAEAMQADGYAALGKLLAGGDLVLIDPPFERDDDYDRAAEAVRLCLQRGAGVAVWAPVKDLETLDALIRRVEDLSPTRLLLAEVRLRPLTNPMTLNGAAMLLVDTPEATAEVEAVCAWVAAHCGGPAARVGVTRLIG